MIGYRVTEDTASPALQRMMRELENPSRAMAAMGNRVVRSIVTSMPRLPREQENEPGRPPAIRSGKFRAGINFQLIAGGRGVDIGTNDVRGRILHEGGDIYPRPGHRALAIPLTRQAEQMWPREWPAGQLIFVPNQTSDDGPPTLCTISRSGAAMVPQYLLVPKVTLKPHPWLRITADDWAYLEQLVRRIVEGQS